MNTLSDNDRLAGLLFRCGAKNTREIADHFGLTLPKARLFLDGLEAQGLLERYAGEGTGAGPGAPYLWANVGQPDPMDPEKRFKQGYDALPTVFIKIDYATGEGDDYVTGQVLVTVVEIAPEEWRAHASEWGASRISSSRPTFAAHDLAIKAGVTILHEAVNPRFAFEIDMSQAA